MHSAYDNDTQSYMWMYKYDLIPRDINPTNRHFLYYYYNNFHDYCGKYDDNGY